VRSLILLLNHSWGCHSVLTETVRLTHLLLEYCFHDTEHSNLIGKPILTMCLSLLKSSRYRNSSLGAEDDLYQIQSSPLKILLKTTKSGHLHEGLAIGLQYELMYTHKMLRKLVLNSIPALVVICIHFRSKSSPLPLK
jgi:hypothetical protein